jgi:thymidylate kinase
MSTKIIAFEGADFSGKSTLAEEMAKSYDFAMLVHFPLMNYDIASAFDSMKKTIYNEEFMNNLTDEDFASLIDALVYNITINNKNQIMFLDNLISIQDKGYTDYTCSVGAIEDFRFFDNGKEIKYNIYMLNFWKMMLNRMMIHEKGVDKAIIFDRSIVSTRVYNYIIPNKVLDKYITKYTNDNTEPSSKIAAKLKEIKSLIRTTQETAEVCYMDKLNKVTYFVLPQIDPFMIICNNSDNVTEFYKQKRADKNDDYDKNTMIQEVAKKYYDDLYNVNTKGTTSKKICNLITNSYEIKPIKANMIFSRITDENVKPEDQVDNLITKIKNYSLRSALEEDKYF